MKIRFVEECVVRDGEDRVLETFEAGKVYEMTTSSAYHWINRNKASLVEGKTRGHRELKTRASELGQDPTETLGPDPKGGSQDPSSSSHQDPA